MKKIYLLLLILVGLSTTSTSFAQKEYNNWVMGYYWLGGLSFNTPSGEPVKLVKYPIEFEEYASISDSSGCLLFYSNSINVWNRYGGFMVNGENLHLGTSFNQVVIVPQPGNNCNYYVFTAVLGNFNSLTYSIADMSLGDGFGELTKKNIRLVSSKSTCLAAVGDATGKNVWISTVDNNTNTLKSFLLTEDSIFSNPVISTFKNRSRIFHFDKIRFSPDGKRLAWTNFMDSVLILFDFDDQTGKFSNEKIIRLNDRNPTNLEFSPNSQLLYIICRKNYDAPIYDIKYLYQYDVSLDNPIDIQNSRYQVYQTNIYVEGLMGLQTGPNNKIYAAHHYFDAFSATDTTNLIVIEKPDLKGNNCKLVINDGNPYKGIVYDFPSKVQNYYPKKKLCTYHNITVCEGQPIQLFSPFFPDGEYEWKGPNQVKIASIQNPILDISRPEHSGNYYFKISRNGIVLKIDSIKILIHPKEKILVKNMNPISLCKDTVLQFLAVTNPDGCIIRWKTIDNPNVSKENLVKISKSGTYTVVVENKFGCKDSATIVINLNIPVNLSIKGNPSFCEGDDNLLSANEIYKKYLWSTGDTTSTIKIKKGGLYTLKVKNDSGCEGVDSITVIENKKPKVEFENSTYTLCTGDSLILKPVEINPEYEYIWSDGYKGIERIIKVDSDLILIAKSKNGCTDTAKVLVGFYDVPEAVIIADKTDACYGEMITLTAKNYNKYLHYLWSNGQTGENIKVTTSGTYKLIVKVGTFCSDTTQVQVKFQPPLNLKLMSENQDPCSTDSVKLYTSTKYSKYLWSTGDTTDYIIAHNSGVYKLTVENELGCPDSSSIAIKVGNRPKSKIIADKTEVCFGEKITLNSENINTKYNYLWSTGEITPEITVDKSGIYKLFVMNEFGCSDTSEIEVKIYPEIILELFADKTNLCFNDSTNLYTTKTYSEYIWSTGETTPNITVKEAGIYQLIVKNEIGCTDTANIEIFKNNMAIEIDKDNLTFDEICVGQTQVRKINVKLVSGDEFKISDIKTNSNNFEIQSSKNILKTGESAEISVTFKPNDSGIFTDELIIESNELCEFKKIITLSATAKQILKFSIPDITKTAGEQIEIPIYAKIICPEPQKFNSDYELKLSFDKEYFLPESVKFGELLTNEIVGNERVVKIKANAEFNQIESEINVLYGQALLGRSETAPIKIIESTIIKDRCFYEFDDGSLNVARCINDISGLQMFTPTKMKINPNPSDGDLKINIGTQETGNFMLVIYDFQGQEIFRREFTKSNRNFEEFDINLSTQNIGTGVYSVVFTAPWKLIREQAVIIK